MSVRILIGDCLDTLSTMPDASVQTCVTSPPYFGLRDYGHAGQIGLEATPDAFVAKLVAVFREVRRVLKDDGTLWLNLGDSYASTGGRSVQSGKEFESRSRGRQELCRSSRYHGGEAKQKDLLGIPWMVAFALRADGWYLRQDIIWSKPNPMPESVRDRCTKAHEYLFLLSKSPRYYFDADAIAEALAESSIERLSQPNLAEQSGSDRVPGKTNGAMKAVGPRFGGAKYGDDESDESRTKSGKEWNPTESAKRLAAKRQEYRASELRDSPNGRRNKRSVWQVATQPFKEAHFATFPTALVEPCILAGSREGDTVLDPFGGAGTTGLVADRLQRLAILCELNPTYAEIAKARIAGDSPLFAEVAA